MGVVYSKSKNNITLNPQIVFTSDNEAVVVAIVVTTVELVKSFIEAWRKIVATASDANTIISQSIFPPDFT